MFFPDSPRVAYARNPLDQVICQLRYPAILRVASQPPVEFQEAIRSTFPLFTERKDSSVDVPPELLKALPPDFFGPQGDTVFDFKTEDEKLTVSLAKEFLALTSQRYTSWEQFRASLLTPFDALKRIYQPSFLVRIGLRYRNIIRRSLLQLGDEPWRNLLADHFVGELKDEQVSQSVKGSANELVLGDSEGRSVRLMHGLITHRPSEEQCYLIDADFFTEKRVGCDEINEVLGSFNADAGRLFRWCITERLHRALEPTTLA